MVLNAAVQMLREADELKQSITKFKSGTSMLQERSLWMKQQQLQKIYQKVLVLDLDYALEKKVEQDLWNVGFKSQIEALQLISKDRKNPIRSEGQAMLSWVLQAAAGFYLCLLHQICTAFKLDLPFRRRASLLGWVEGWGAGEAACSGRLPPPAAARYICQDCLVHLGDLARYRQQLRVAHTFYRHALVVSAHSGQPYNQLALVAWRRGRRLAALYWHVRSLLVRVPFPPAPANLARTLQAAASGGLSRDSNVPVLPGVTDTSGGPSAAAGSEPATPARLDAHAYVTELIRALHMIHSVEQLDTAASIVETLNASLTSLIATDSFESMTLIKMSCVLIWLVHSCTEDLKVEPSSLSADEAQAAWLAEDLAAAAVLALLLPTYTADGPPARVLPPLKVWLQWCVSHPVFIQSGAWRARPALWPALAAALARLARLPPPQLQLDADAYETVPLPEDEELHGFVPLEQELKPLRFPNHAAWDTYGGRVPTSDATESDTRGEVSTTCLSNEPELEQKVRAYRLLQLGRRLADLRPDHLSYTEDEEGRLKFTASSAGGEQLSAALASLAVTGGGGGAGGGGAAGAGAGGGERLSDDSDDEPAPPKPPIVISEADFREKVREKRAGILKPQGSLERAREERALATQDDTPTEEEGGEESKGEDKKEVRKPRVNIAMAAIMRKQEETNKKEVKFVTPPPTPDSTTDANSTDKPKVIQPKAIKGLNALPLGRKTGGILSLKDKSAGYPHLVNTDPEPAKKPEKEEKKEQKPNQNSQPKRQEHAPSPSWSTNAANASESPRNFQKSYGAQAGPGYSPSYSSPTNVGGGGIRLPVVNPKEIDVRTAALQKQNSRQDLFQDGHKFNQGYQMSGDKKSFLNDLPPRFANQYRYWQAHTDSQFDDNKFRDHSFAASSLLNQHQNSWISAPQQQVQENYQQQMPWWKPESPPSFNATYSQPTSAPGYYSGLAPAASPYRGAPPYNQGGTQGMGAGFNQGQTQGMGAGFNQGGTQGMGAGFNQGQSQAMGAGFTQGQTQGMGAGFNQGGTSGLGAGFTQGGLQGMAPGFNQGGTQGMGAGFGQRQGQGAGGKAEAAGGYMQPPLQALQNIVSSPNFNSSLNNFSNYSVGYDSSMYPQFSSSKLGYQLPVSKPAQYQPGKDLMEMTLGFGAGAHDRQRSLNMSFGDPLSSDVGALKNMDSMTSGEGSSSGGGEVPANTYSLFSGAPDARAWPAPAPGPTLAPGPGPAHNQPHQSLWLGAGPSPLERLLEQQKQLKQPPQPQ